MIEPIEMGIESPGDPGCAGAFEGDLEGLLRGVEADPFEERAWRALCDEYLERGDQARHDYASTWVVGNFEKARRMQFPIPPWDPERKRVATEQLLFHIGILRSGKLEDGNEVPATEEDLATGARGATRYFKG